MAEQIKCKAAISVNRSASTREPIIIDYQYVTKPRSVCKQLLMFRCVWQATVGRIDGAHGPDLARGPDFADPSFKWSNPVQP